jgi:PKD repeat protein
MVETVGIVTQVMWTPMSPRPNEEVTFTDVTNNVIKLDFGDGRFWVSTSATDKFPVKHTYVKEGSYKFTAIAKDSAGNVGTDSQTIIVSAGVIPPVDPPVEPPVEPPVTPGYWANLFGSLLKFLKSIFGIKS